MNLKFEVVDGLSYYTCADCGVKVRLGSHLGLVCEVEYDCLDARNSANPKLLLPGLHLQQTASTHRYRNVGVGGPPCTWGFLADQCLLMDEYGKLCVRQSSILHRPEHPVVKQFLDWCGVTYGDRT